MLTIMYIMLKYNIHYYFCSTVAVDGTKYIMGLVDNEGKLNIFDL